VGGQRTAHGLTLTLETPVVLNVSASIILFALNVSASIILFALNVSA